MMNSKAYVIARCGSTPSPPPPLSRQRTVLLSMGVCAARKTASCLRVRVGLGLGLGLGLELGLEQVVPARVVPHVARGVQLEEVVEDAQRVRLREWREDLRQLHLSVASASWAWADSQCARRPGLGGS